MSDEEIMTAYGGESKIDMPPTTDRRWRTWTLPLQRFLDKPKTMKEIETWASAMGVDGYKLLNLLAWLSFKGIAKANGKTWTIDFT